MAKVELRTDWFDASGVLHRVRDNPHTFEDDLLDSVPYGAKIDGEVKKKGAEKSVKKEPEKEPDQKSLDLGGAKK